MIQLLIVDIQEQSEVIELFREATSWLSEKFPKIEFKLHDYQLRSDHSECDYNFSSLQLNAKFDLVFMHTKIFKTAHGEFLNKSWWLKFMNQSGLMHQPHFYFYSGYIIEFEQWFKKLNPSERESFKNIKFLDVFDLMYPPNFEKFEHWLEQQVAFTLNQP